ncbi:hypothetical protein F4553_002684 [Allocatelliglobosispora scoriae]|uniref:DM13 domain-containing protein n=1 Tax=Allocatelliglobosispora scoriae TaxID=643052 RepID=A0A841BNQ0_9ACTN|nr:DM13 domain-containing protein [Allocatelliglobosispora scoriae]MBB5869305.1 hypothetical protein [Allocatelliglobosispora scoriae]
MRRALRKPLTWVIIGLLAVVAGAGLYWFAPWRLLTSTTVTEAVPVVTVPSSAPATPDPVAPSPSPVNVLLATGSFVTHEHETTGKAQLVRLADGSVRVVLLGLRTSDGPDLRVWLTDQRVTKSWYVFDDGRHVELGKLKGNRGDQVYAVPAGVDLTGLRSVTIWCKRFSVSFGAAELA